MITNGNQSGCRNDDVIRRRRTDTRMCWDFVGAKGDGGGGENWSYKSCKALVKSSPSTNQHAAFYRPDVLPVAQPTVSDH